MTDPYSSRWLQFSVRSGINGNHPPFSEFPRHVGTSTLILSKAGITNNPSLMGYEHRPGTYGLNLHPRDRPWNFRQWIKVLHRVDNASLCSDRSKFKIISVIRALIILHLGKSPQIIFKVKEQSQSNITKCTRKQSNINKNWQKKTNTAFGYWNYEIYFKYSTTISKHN